MQIAKFMDAARVPMPADHDDRPISGGVGSVLARGYPAQLAQMNVDHLLMTAGPAELASLAERWGIPAHIVVRRSKALIGQAAHQIAKRREG
ncbi:hypothetical protein [Tritonibacter mobilis]|uniref:Uncharacterized protein n=1 Tax=Tritonibacter mobilis F1926 TaxID=1265309 RepID=A0A1B1A0A8_9RHOB|nr:hypothetical protein [Tritonibacter mobilis]ANP39917.1 hypothetical protein K529_003985 [Tritonibacter mobilis F1926]KJZ21845.1 hypothetical protein TW79_20900 [Tritonibacter mobilis]